MVIFEFNNMVGHKQLALEQPTCNFVFRGYEVGTNSPIRVFLPIVLM